MTKREVKIERDSTIDRYLGVIGSAILTWRSEMTKREVKIERDKATDRYLGMITQQKTLGESEFVGKVVEGCVEKYGRAAVIRIDVSFIKYRLCEGAMVATVVEEMEWIGGA